MCIRDSCSLNREDQNQDTKEQQGRGGKEPVQRIEAMYPYKAMEEGAQSLTADTTGVNNDSISL